MKMIDYNLLKGKITAMQSTEPEYAFNFLNNAQNPSTEWDCIEDMLDSMEVYEAEPVKHGRWIRIIGALYECTECKAKLWLGSVNPADKYHYCWMCGAKMDLPEPPKECDTSCPESNN